MTGEEKMRYAIIESGGKQYRAVEGQTIAVDRLSDEAGKQVDLRALLMADGDDFMVGTPAIEGIQVKATIVSHILGPKVDRFKYSPKKRIRVRGGHRQQFTQLMVDFIGREGEERKVEKAEEPAAQAEAPVEEPVKKAPAKKAAEKKTVTKKAAATKSKTTTKKSTK
jgi:large subunit ribosomal protein L21